MSLSSVVEYVWKHPSNRGRRLSAFRHALAWQVHKRLRGVKEIRVFDDMTMRCHPGSLGAGVMIYSHGWPDYDEMHFASRLLRPGDSFLDIGANVGVYSMLAAKLVGPNGRVLAFEPGRKAYGILVENIRLNRLDQVETRFSVVGDSTDKVRFYQNKDVMNRIVSSSENEQANDALVSFEEIESTTLNLLCQQDQFALGKIDIEGAEPIVFGAGMESLANANPSVWIMEFKDRLLKKFDWTAERLAKLMADAGFRLATYEADSNQLEFPERAWTDHENVFAIHDSALDSVRERLAESFGRNSQ